MCLIVGQKGDDIASCDDAMFFFFNDTATTEIYTLSLHDALPISLGKIKLRFNKETKSFYFPTKSINAGDEQTDIHSDNSSHHGERATGNPPQSESGDSDPSGNGDDRCHW